MIAICVIMNEQKVWKYDTMKLWNYDTLWTRSRNHEHEQNQKTVNKQNKNKKNTNTDQDQDQEHTLFHHPSALQMTIWRGWVYQTSVALLPSPSIGHEWNKIKNQDSKKRMKKTQDKHKNKNKKKKKAGDILNT